MEEKKEVRKTAGQLALELAAKTPYTVPLKDFTAELLDDNGKYMKTLWEAADYGKKIGYHDLNGKFYIQISTNRERILHNIIRNKFTVEIACPLPTFMQTIYQYDSKHNRIQLFWTIPDIDGCNRLMRDALMIETEDERRALKYVMDFYNGTLDEMCSYLNKGGEIN
jgi:hypothetical protein